MTTFSFSNEPEVLACPLPHVPQIRRRATETSAPEILRINQPIKPRIRSVWVVQDNNLVQHWIKA
jgi:hypothetical protein